MVFLQPAHARETSCEAAAMPVQAATWTAFQSALAEVKVLAASHHLGAWAELWERALLLRALRPEWSSRELARHVTADAARPLLHRQWKELQSLTPALRAALVQRWVKDSGMAASTVERQFDLELEELMALFPRDDQPLTMEQVVRIQIRYARLQEPNLIESPEAMFQETIRRFPYDFPVFLWGAFHPRTQFDLGAARWFLRSQLPLAQSLVVHGRERSGGYLFFHDHQHAFVMQMQDPGLWKGALSEQPGLERWVASIGFDLNRRARLRQVLDSPLREFIVHIWFHEWGGVRHDAHAVDRMIETLMSSDGDWFRSRLPQWTRKDFERELPLQVQVLADLLNP